jgi:hypothetical protein
MTTFSDKHLALALLGASTALALVAAPYHITIVGFSTDLVPAAAFAEDGVSDGLGSGDGRGDASDSDGSDRGDSDGVNGLRANEHVNPVTGIIVEINGSDIEVQHPDGIKEKIENGRYEMKDANDRTIVERDATESDRGRLRALAG